MGWASGVLVYIVLWWLIFFTTLPFGVRPPHEAGETIVKGQEEGAPVRHHLLLKAMATTVIAGLLWGVAYWLIDSDMLSFRNR